MIKTMMTHTQWSLSQAMKAFFATLALLLLPTLSTAATVDKTASAAERFANHYEVLEGRTRSTTPVVDEVFSVYCAGCYYWDQNIVPDLKAKLKEKKVDFEQTHASFMGRYGEKATQALAIALRSNQFDALKKQMFERIQGQRKDWSSDADFFATLQAAGMSEDTFKTNQNNMFVLATLNKWKNMQDSLSAVPSFIVNNKYLVKPEGLKGKDEFFEVVDYLLTLP